MYPIDVLNTEIIRCLGHESGHFFLCSDKGGN